MFKVSMGILGASALGLGVLMLKSIGDAKIEAKQDETVLNFTMRSESAYKCGDRAFQWFLEAHKNGYRNDTYTIIDEKLLLNRDIQKKMIINGLSHILENREEFATGVRNYIKRQQDLIIPSEVSTQAVTFEDIVDDGNITDTLWSQTERIIETEDDLYDEAD